MSMFTRLGAAALLLMGAVALMGQAIPNPHPTVSAGAPSDATYVTQTANGTLTAEQSLAALSTGIMRVATTTGVVTSLTDSAGLAANLSDEIGSGSLTFATRSVEAVTTTKAPTAAESTEVYTNTGDADGATVTLPDDPTVGLTYTFIVTATATLTIVASAGETLELANDPCVVSLTNGTQGSAVVITAAVGGSGGRWFAHSATGTWVCND